MTRIVADCLEMRRLGARMREHAVGLAVTGEACGGLAAGVPAMPSWVAQIAVDSLLDARSVVKAVAYEIAVDAGEVYRRADWAQIAGIPGSVGWLFALRSDKAVPTRIEWERITKAAITALSLAASAGGDARKTASAISQVWRWSDDPARRKLASRQIGQAGRWTKWADTPWIKRGGPLLAIIDGLMTLQEHRSDKDLPEAVARTVAEVGAPAAAGWGAGALCILGVAGTPLSGGASVVLCSGAAIGAGAATDRSGFGRWLGDRIDAEFIHPGRDHIVIDVPPPGQTFEEYFSDEPIFDADGHP